MMNYILVRTLSTRQRNNIKMCQPYARTTQNLQNKLTILEMSLDTRNCTVWTLWLRPKLQLCVLIFGLP